MNTCRFCKLSSYDKTKFPLIKYGPRHYAHADCGLSRFGIEFFDKLSQHQLETFPYFAAREAGVHAELEKRYRSRLLSTPS